MNAEEIYDAVTDVREDLVTETGKEPKKHKRPAGRRWIGAVAAVLVLAVALGIFLRPGGDLSAAAICQAEYPEMAPYPGWVHTDEQYDAWWESITAQRRELGDLEPLNDFFSRSAQAFLTQSPGENLVYSPLNVYLALSMLAQITDGTSREQILTLLGSGSMDELRKQANDIWNSNYRDDGALTSILASSVWLNRDVSFVPETMELLAKEFYASSYQGEMGSDGFNRALQDWLNEQTGGLLEEQAGQIEMSPDTILALATTVYFQAKWTHDFNKSATEQRAFHSAAGDVQADFMLQRIDQDYFWGDHFAAISQPFEGGGSMWFLLPDGGVTPEDLLNDQQALRFLFHRGEWENRKFLFVNKAIPRFDVSSMFDLAGGLESLGVTDIFDPALSDFTPMTAEPNLPVYVSDISHAARVSIDEEGCTATAFTVEVASAGAEPPDDEVDFVLDRPFLFCIEGISGLPLFVGVVNHPQA